MNGESIFYDPKLVPLKNIRFTVLGNEQVLKNSVISADKRGIDVSELYASSDPKKNGLMSPELGVTDNHQLCATCGFGKLNCPGHFGHLKLSQCLFHDGFLGLVKDILSIICLKCSKLLLPKKERELMELMVKDAKYPRLRVNLIKKLISNVQYCANGCGEPVKNIKKENKKTSLIIGLVAESKHVDEGKVILVKEKLNATYCKGVLEEISLSDQRLMGINTEFMNPSMLIYDIFTIPPIAIRPSSRVQDLDNLKEDDLTHKLVDIIKTENRIYKVLQSRSENKPKSLETLKILAQFHVTSYVQNDPGGVMEATKKQKTIKPLSSRFQKKEGRIRGNLCGKRVEGSGRTVIGSDSTEEINQMGVPIEMCMNLTYQEVVTPKNIKFLEKLVKNGRYKYPGANYVYQKNKKKPEREIYPIDLRYSQPEINYGDIVDRHLIDGDYALFNRQPTLHKLSMMGHKIYIIKNKNIKTFRLNPSVTVPYNADFDGDEMNMFVPQSVQAAIELEHICNVMYQIISPAGSSPTIGMVQDNTVGSFMLSNDKTIISMKRAMNMIAYTNVENPSVLGTIKKNKLMSGKELLSIILPNNLNMLGATVIEKGKFSKGRLTSKHVSKGSHNSIQHLIWNQYGPLETKNFLDNLQRMGNIFLIYNGLTVGIKDTRIPKDLQIQIETIVKQKELEGEHLLTNMENNPDVLKKSVFEDMMFNFYNIIRPDVSKMIIDNLTEENNFQKMIVSGSKGNDINMGGMCGCFGQQGMDNGRISNVKMNKRSTHYSFQNDNRGPARGFIRNSYLKGMSSSELIMTNMGARADMISTSIQTADTGYVQRRMVKSVEDIYIEYGMKVVNSRGIIYQFNFGDTGINTVEQHKISLDSLKLSNLNMDKKFGFTKDEILKYKFKNFKKLDSDNYVKQLIMLRDDIRKKRHCLQVNRAIFETTYMLPVHIKNIFESLLTSNKKTLKSDLEPDYIISKLEDIVDYRNTKIGCVDMSDPNYKDSIRHKDEINCKKLFKYSLHEFINPRTCIIENKISKKTFDHYCKRIIKSFNKSVVEPGEMVGVVAGQTLGEKTSQATLSKFHSAGVGVKQTGSTGITRIKEVINVSKNPKGPSMSIYLEDNIKNSDIDAKKIASELRMTKVKDLINFSEFYYDPNPDPSRGLMKKDNVKKAFHSVSSSKSRCLDTIDNLNWLIRLELNKDKMMERGISLIDIKINFCKNWEMRFSDVKKNKKTEERKILDIMTQCSILSNNDSDDIPTIHVRFELIDFDFNIINNFTQSFIENLRIKGIQGISDILGISDENYADFDKETGELKIEKRKVIHVEGLNVSSLSKIKGIDAYKSFTHDIITVYDIMGINAARMLILKIFREIFTDNTNYQHLTIMADLMTNKGCLTSIDRHGFNKNEIETLSKVSFENMNENFNNAALNSEKNSINNVVSRIIMGMPIKGGTNLCDLILDTETLINSEYSQGSNKVDYVKNDSRMEDILGKDIDEIDSHIPGFLII